MSEMRKFNPSLVIASMLFIIATPSKSQETPSYNLEDLSKLARKSVVYLTVSHVDSNNPKNICTKVTQGTGFIISNDGYLLTASHNLQPPEECEQHIQLKIEGRIGYRKNKPLFSLAKVGQDDNLDVAILKFSPRGEAFNYATICNSQRMESGKKLAAFGFPKGSGFAPLPTIYSNSDGDAGRWVASSDFTHGVSGGPVYDYTGKVIGMVQGGLKNTPAVRFIVPLRYAANMIALSGEKLENCTKPIQPTSKIKIGLIDGDHISYQEDAGINKLRNRTVIRAAFQQIYPSNAYEFDPIGVWETWYQPNTIANKNFNLIIVHWSSLSKVGCNPRLDINNCVTDSKGAYANHFMGILQTINTNSKTDPKFIIYSRRRSLCGKKFREGLISNINNKDFAKKVGLISMVKDFKRGNHWSNIYAISDLTKFVNYFLKKPPNLFKHQPDKGICLLVDP